MGVSSDKLIAWYTKHKAPTEMCRPLCLCSVLPCLPGGAILNHDLLVYALGVEGKLLRHGLNSNGPTNRAVRFQTRPRRILKVRKRHTKATSPLRCPRRPTPSRGTDPVLLVSVIFDTILQRERSLLIPTVGRPGGRPGRAAPSGTHAAPVPGVGPVAVGARTPAARIDSKCGKAHGETTTRRRWAFPKQETSDLAVIQ